MGAPTGEMARWLVPLLLTPLQKVSPLVGPKEHPLFPGKKIKVQRSNQKAIMHRTTYWRKDGQAHAGPLEDPVAFHEEACPEFRRIRE